jgi:hypothetical protein
MMLTLFPYYTKAKAAGGSTSGDAGEQLRRLQGEIAALQDQLATAQHDQNELMVAATWDGGGDVDLWIESGGKWAGPKVATPWGGKRETATTDDAGTGPTGREQWGVRGFSQGNVFKVFYQLYKKNPQSPAPIVRGYVAAFWSDPKEGGYLNFLRLPTVQLGQEGQTLPAGEVHVGADGPAVSAANSGGQAHLGRDGGGPGGPRGPESSGSAGNRTLLLRPGGPGE